MILWLVEFFWTQQFPNIPECMEPFTINNSIIILIISGWYRTTVVRTTDKVTRTVGIIIAVAVTIATGTLQTAQC